ncbi:MAG: amidase domain-containing protein [Lachnospiraceae bacterium]|nr:amidase domain-containing protein [Lachnospiraceae bacterium]
MKKIIMMMLCSAVIFVCASPVYASSYSSGKAAEYALKWALSRNPDYYSYRDHDCANFVSQSLHAGNIPKNNTWKGGRRKSDNTDAWVNCPKQNSYFKNKGWSKQILSVKGVDNANSKDGRVNVGNLVYYDYTSDGRIDHVSIYTTVGSYGDRYVCAHTNDRWNASWTLRTQFIDNGVDLKGVSLYVVKITY